jgi:hypothetical protein
LLLKFITKNLFSVKISSNENNSLSLNSVLIAMGAFALIVGAISSVLSAILVGCCTDKRVNIYEFPKVLLAKN